MFYILKGQGVKQSREEHDFFLPFANGLYMTNPTFQRASELALCK